MGVLYDQLTIPAMGHTGNSTNDKIDRLKQKAFDIRVSDSIQALALSREAVELSRKDSYEMGLAEGLRTLGFCYIRQSKYWEAQECLDESLSHFESLDHQPGQIHVFEYYGIIRRNSGDYKGSLESLYHALELIKESGYDQNESLVQYHIGTTYKYLGDEEKALECFLKSLDIARHLKKSNLNQHDAAATGESYSLNNIGGIYFESGDYENALKYYKESLVLRKEDGDQWGEA